MAVIASTRVSISVPEPVRLRFDALELPVVLSHYDLGVIESLTELTRGSGRSPKLGIVAQEGKFLLKRRSPELTHPDAIAFSHQLQAHLAAAGFPAPRLIPTRSGGRTLLVLGESVYEMFEFVAGHAYDGSIAQTRDAGAVLARFHVTAADLAVRCPVPQGDYHDNNAVRTGLKAAETKLADRGDAAALVGALGRAYNQAVDRCEQAGMRTLPAAVIHADWHPGNMLFRRDRVAAVIDYDSVRVSRRVIDVANGALQFSMPGEGDPTTWPDHLDLDRYAAFIAGYDAAVALQAGERHCLPELMVQTLIAECVPPISRTGSFGGFCGFDVLEVIRRKLAWLEEHRKELIQVATGGQRPANER